MLYRKIIFFYYIWQPIDSAEEPNYKAPLEYERIKAVA
jgi:hypothetical protein